MATRSKLLRPLTHLHRFGIYFQGALLTLLRSRWAQPINMLLAAAVVVFAAAPDFGIEWAKGGLGFMFLVSLFFVSQAFGVFVQGSASQAYIDTFSALANIISSLADGARGMGSGPQILVQPSQAIEALLRRACDFANDTLMLPVGAQLSATLLLPVQLPDETIGLQATYREELKWNAVRRIVPLDSPGAGEAFQTGNPTAVADIAEVVDRTDGTPWPYRSIAAFPVLAGAREECPVPLGVITLDCMIPFVFTNRRVQRELAPFIQPIAQLVGLALQLHQQGMQRLDAALTKEELLEEVRKLLEEPRSNPT